jgi:lytic murein transglycosylase B
MIGQHASSAPSRRRLALLAALMLSATASWQGALAQPAAPSKQAAPLTPGQPPQTPASGGTFEEEIIPQRYANNADVSSFIDDMVARYDFDPTALHALFAGVSYSATAVRLVTPSPTPSAKNWHAYRARFLDPVRINAGVKFWRENRATLERAYEQYGVPPEIVVGILGVETIYGRYMGNFRVLDALTKLAFDYPNTPNRAEREMTFRKNLEDYLVWTRDAQVDPTTVLGSYTGAIGIPQFLPSSIVKYAVDYEGNKHVDLRASPADAIGSVANYLKENGWENGRPVVWRIAHDAGSPGGRRRATRAALAARAVAARRHAARRTGARHDGRGEHACHDHRSADARSTNPVQARLAEFLCADALQPQLLLRACRVRTGPARQSAHRRRDGRRAAGRAGLDARARERQRADAERSAQPTCRSLVGRAITAVGAATVIVSGAATATLGIPRAERRNARCLGCALGLRAGGPQNVKLALVGETVTL